jgi:hypothetical protein
MTLLPAKQILLLILNLCTGVGSPRALSVTGQPLPSPRLISVNVHPDTSRPHVRYSLMFMQYAQLLDHDLTHTPVNKGTSNMEVKSMYLIHSL